MLATGRITFSLGVAFGLASLDGPDRGVTVQIDANDLLDVRVKSFGPIR